MGPSARAAVRLESLTYMFALACSKNSAEPSRETAVDVKVAPAWSWLTNAFVDAASGTRFR